jgi:hypothetical protein
LDGERDDEREEAEDEEAVDQPFAALDSQPGRHGG